MNARRDFTTKMQNSPAETTPSCQPVELLAAWSRCFHLASCDWQVNQFVSRPIINSALMTGLQPIMVEVVLVLVLGGAIIQQGCEKSMH